jgi:hypothetical protein
VPFEEYMHGFGSPDFSPMIGTCKLQSAIERYNFGPLFSRALKTTRVGGLPEGQWRIPIRVSGMFTLLRQATATIGREAGGR